MGSARMFAPRRTDKNWWQRLLGLNWFIILLILILGGFGVAMQYSVAGGSFEPWARIHLIRLLPTMLLMLVIAATDIRIWFALAYPAWIGGLALLLAVELIGATGMGGQRWLDLGIARLQPSELMKVATILALARYFHGLDFYQSRRLFNLLPPLFLIAVPVLVVIRQPDLGTGLMIFAVGAITIFMAGARSYIFWSGGAVLAITPWVIWPMLRDYQRDRILTFLNPESDPLGAGYQITQSKIALGSGGMSGKGFLQGTQSQLNFLPEMKTDFIFTVVVEEFGMLGGFALLGVCLIILGYGILIGLGCRNQFGRLLSVGLSFTLFMYIFINVGMVMGLLPVVGVPFPLVSYGGSAMITFMIAYGLILSVASHRDVSLAPKGSGLG